MMVKTVVRVLMVAGAPGDTGASGLNSLITQTKLALGSDCTFGGLQVDSGLDTNG